MATKPTFVSGVKLTAGEAYGYAMYIESQDEAKSYFDELVKHCMSFGYSQEEAENIQRSNLGYICGYYDSEVRERVYRLFCTTHPILGNV